MSNLVAAGWIGLVLAFGGCGKSEKAKGRGDDAASAVAAPEKSCRALLIDLELLCTPGADRARVAQGTDFILGMYECGDPRGWGLESYGECGRSPLAQDIWRKIQVHWMATKQR